ncbi:MAG: GreA/GreB family elongation factor [Cyclobacteriaceae bacterium]|nr:GreA/GreB family elongation factor [Cyclobacteriaceae bacterium SS2]
MKHRCIIVEKSEYNWILALIEKSQYTDPVSQRCLDYLQKELKLATIKDEADMPDDIVRLNSMVSVETPYGPKTGLQLVAPAERNIAEDKISILSPMGSALFGYAKGDKIKWIFPKGEGKIKIIDVQNAPKNISTEKTVRVE